MYEHLVMFQFKEEVTPEQQQELALKLLAFKGKISGLMDMTAGLNETKETEHAQGFTLGLRMTFQDKQSLEEYLPHPEHQEFLSSLDGMIENVVVMDYEVAW